MNAAVRSQVLYSYDQGFLPMELMNSACASDLNWSPNPAEFTCREPGMKPMDEALTKHSQWAYNPVYIHFSFVDNWILISNAVSWSDPPLPPKNGSIGVYTSAVEGSVVAFFCNEGLIPVGQTNTTCVSNGSWTPNPADLVCIEQPAEDEGFSIISTTYFCVGSCSISRSGLLTYTRLRDGLINLAKSFCKEIQLLKGRVQNYVGLVLLEIWKLGWAM